MSDEETDLYDLILRELREDPTIRTKDLATKLNVLPSRISKHISKLMKRRMIARFNYSDEDGIIQKARIPISGSSAWLEHKADMNIDVKPVTRTNFLHLQVIPNAEYGTCGLSALIQNSKGNQGLRLSWEWQRSVPEKEFHPFDETDVRLMGFHNGQISVTRKDGKVIQLSQLAPSNYYIVHVSIFNSLGQEVRISYLIVKKSQFLSYVYHITGEEQVYSTSRRKRSKSSDDTASQGDKNADSKSKVQKPILYNPVLVLSDVGGNMYQSQGLVAELMAGRYAAFGVSIGSIDRWDSYMGKLKTAGLTSKSATQYADSYMSKRETDFFLKSIHVLKATDPRNKLPVYEIVLEVWHVKGMMKFLILDERYVHEGWMDDYANFEERIRDIASKHHVHVEFIDAEFYKNELDICSNESNELKRKHAYQYLSSLKTTGLFMLKYLYEH